MKKITTILSVILMFVGLQGYAQLTVSTGMTPTQYVQNNLLGLGVTVSNVTFTGNVSQMGSFNGSASNIGFASGIVLGSTAVSELQGNGASTVSGTTNVSGVSNADLLTVAQSVTSNPSAGSITSTSDLAMLEFDFVPESDLVTFNFVFGSDEYLTYVNTQFNDVFGFFVSGPGISGPYAAPAGFPNGSANLAFVPGTTQPITISTIHPGLNSQYYVDNASGTTNALNGFTVPMPITFPVQCGQTYHFKFAVADCQDNYLGTVVFLEEGSFTSPPINLSLSNASGGGSTTIVEACSDASFLLTRSVCQSINDLTFNFAMSGSATYGADYTLAQTSPLVFPAGEDTMYLDFSTIADALVEGTETVTITIDYIDQYGNPQTSSGTFFLSDIQPLALNPVDQSLFCNNDTIVLVTQPTGGSGNYTFVWEGNPSTISTANVIVGPNGTYAYPVTMTDECLGSLTDTVMVTMNQTLAIDTMIQYPASACTPDGAVSGEVVGLTGLAQYHWEGPNTGGPSQINASVMQNLSPGWYIFTITDNVCSVTDSILLTSEPGPIADMTLSSIAGCNPLNVTFTNNSQNATSFEWYFGNGNTAFVNDMSSQSQTYTASANEIVLIAINGPCRDTAFASVLIVECGCTDPLATNFDPTAVQDDGSCIFPEPTVIVPNIFTPNGDANNDVFKLTTTNATDVIIKINNRWGNNVYVGSGLDPHWDGKIDGTIAPDGVYFVQYTVKGLMGKEITGQGFLQLIRQ